MEKIMNKLNGNVGLISLAINIITIVILFTTFIWPLIARLERMEFNLKNMAGKIDVIYIE